MLVNIEQINFFFCKYNKENICSETKQNTHFFFGKLMYRQMITFLKIVLFFVLIVKEFSDTWHMMKIILTTSCIRSKKIQDLY